MCFTNFLLIILSVCLISKGVQCDLTDDPPATNEQLYGPNMCCLFSFDSYVDIDKMHKEAPSAKIFSIAYWPNHRLAFATLPQTDYVYVTAVLDPEEFWDLYGVAYLVSVEEYNKFVKRITIDYNQQRVGHAVTVKVTQEGTTTSIDCNVLLDAGQAATLPSKSLIHSLFEIFNMAHLPPRYAEMVKALKTKD